MQFVKGAEINGSFSGGKKTWTRNSRQRESLEKKARSSDNMVSADSR